MNSRAPSDMHARLALARACAWSLLLAGWVGIGSLALALAPSASNHNATTA